MEGLTLTKVGKNCLPEKYRTLGTRKDETWTNPCKKEREKIVLVKPNLKKKEKRASYHQA